MTISLKVIFGLILLGGYSYYLKSKIATLEARLSVSEETLIILRQSLGAQYQELQKRQIELANIKSERKERDKEYEEIKANDFESCDWASTHLPGTIVDFLCQNP
jgi:uncharacterized coiled-coil protein SlyX